MTKALHATSSAMSIGRSKCAPRIGGTAPVPSTTAEQEREHAEDDESGGARKAIWSLASSTSSWAVSPQTERNGASRATPRLPDAPGFLS